MKPLFSKNLKNLDIFRSHFLLFLFLSVFFAISSVPVWLSLRISSILLLQILIGQEIYRIVSKNISTSVVERTAMGFSIGALLWLIVDQILLRLSLPGIGWSLITLQIVVVLWAIFRRSADDALQFRVSLEALGWLTVATLVGLSGEWVWPLPLAVVGIVVLLARHFRFFNQHRFFDRLAMLTLVCTGITVLATRPKIWWITQSDQPFYQAISSSLAKWGFNDNTLSSGFRLSYHWFPYAWSGLVQRLSGAPEWIVITRVGPIVATVCIVSLVWVICRRIVDDQNAAALTVVVFAASPVFGVISLNIDLAMFGSYSQMFASIWLIPVLLWMIDADRRTSLPNTVLITVLLVGMVGGKVSHAAIALTAILGFEVFRFITKPELRKSAALESGVALLTVLGTAYLLFGNDGSISFRFLSWVSYVQGDLDPFVRGDLEGYSRWKLVLLAGALLLGIMYAALATIIAGFLSLRRYSAIYFGFSCCIILSVVLSNFSSGPYGTNGLYFVHAAFIIAVILSGPIGWKLLRTLAASNFKGRLISVLISAIVVSLSVSFFVPSLNSGTSSAAYLRTSRSLNFLVGVLVLIAAMSIFRKKIPRVSNFLVPLVLVFSIGLSSVSFFVESAISFQKNYSGFTKSSPYYVATADLEQLARWFESETPESEIYASNYFCNDKNCSSPDYSEKSLMSALINRRSLIQAPYFAAAYTRAKNSTEAGEIPARISASKTFASLPSVETLDFLLQRNVRWYVIDRSVDASDRWKMSNAVAFSNDEFLVVDLERVTLEP